MSVTVIYRELRRFDMNIAKWIIIGIGLVILLAGGAYFGAQALASRGTGDETAVSFPNSNDGLSGIVMDQGEGGLPEDGASGQMMEIAVENAAELPDRDPDASGFVLQREDDTFLIGTGEPNITVEMNDDGTPNISINGTEGPAVQVVITRDTQLFEDASDMTALFSGESDTFQQEVRQIDSLDDVTENVTMLVWGTKRGERIVADVVLVIPPVAVSGPVQP
jgi:hypothetical protein